MKTLESLPLQLLQLATKKFQDEFFKNHLEVEKEIEKKVKALQMMKNCQLKELQRMGSERHILQERAENLAEKYKDIKDKQKVCSCTSLVNVGRFQLSSLVPMARC